MAETKKRLAQILADLRPSARRHKALLRAQRNDGHWRETSLEFQPDRLVFHRSDWVSVWLDLRQIALSRDGLITATRAITPYGRLLWLVRHCDHKRPFHSREADATAAFADAEAAWARRRQHRAVRSEVADIVRDLRRFRKRYRVTLDDAYRSPLCDEGVDGFLTTLGIAGFRSYPGWLIAWFYGFDRQVGYVLYEAHRRQTAQPSRADAANSTCR
jgi:hypothetical protein